MKLLHYHSEKDYRNIFAYLIWSFGKNSFTYLWGTVGKIAATCDWAVFDCDATATTKIGDAWRTNFQQVSVSMAVDELSIRLSTCDHWMNYQHRRRPNRLD